MGINIKKTRKIELPLSWELVPLGNILLKIIGGGTPSKKIPEYYKGNIPWFTVKDMRTRRPFDSIDHISKKAVKESSTNIIPENTVIIATRIGLGRVIRVPFVAAINQDLKALFTTPEIDKGYLEYWFVSIADYLDSIGSGTTVKGIRLEILKELQFPLAPLNDQKRIVAEIEKQFSRLDEAVENLKRVKVNLKRYKASVLKAAVEGKLTEDWRAKHPDVEPADKLLGRILAERRKKWEEAELSKMKKAGKEPKDDKWKKKYKEPSQADISTLDELPNGWNWLTSDQLFWFVTSGSRGWAKYYSDSGAVFLRIGNLDHDTVSLDLKKVQFVKPPRGAEGTRTRVEENDILISITADVGMIGIVQKGFGEAYINQHISLARPVSTINSLYLAWYLTSRLGQNQFGVLQRGATKAGLGLDDIRSVKIPMPPFEEQEEIISQMEKRLSVVDEIEIEADKNLKRSVRLRQSILKKAFSGRLIQSKEA